jgi:hypothetical protein
MYSTLDECVMMVSLSRLVLVSEELTIEYG